MTASTRDAVWTGLLAGAVAHDINNFVQGVSSARALAGTPGAIVADAAETEAIIEDELEELRKMGGRLRALASAGSTGACTRLADACADAFAEVDRSPEQLRAESIPADLWVVGTAAALTTAIASLLEHAMAASPASAPVRVAIRRSQAGSPVIVEIGAPEAGALGALGKARLASVLASALPELRGDARLILAGAIADALGGAVYIASDAEAGLVLALHLVARAPPIKQSAGADQCPEAGI
jgi:signal transduction histidine kinase